MNIFLTNLNFSLRYVDDTQAVFEKGEDTYIIYNYI